MGTARFVMVVINATIFGILFGMSLSRRHFESSLRIRRLWLTVAFVTGALLIGAVQRIILQANLIGLLDSSISDRALTEWQLIQSFVVATLAIGAFVSVRDSANAFATTERVAGTLVDRVKLVDVEALSLSVREVQVLSVIGSGLLSDAELCERLGISASTVQTHIKSLLRKTGLNKRTDLIAVAVIMEMRA